MRRAASRVHGTDDGGSVHLARGLLADLRRDELHQQRRQRLSVR